MHDVACEFASAVVRSKDVQKQLARTAALIFSGLLNTSNTCSKHHQI